jgi:hypothetical protein
LSRSFVPDSTELSPTPRTECVKCGVRPIADLVDEFDGTLAVEVDRVQELVVAQGNGVLGESNHRWRVKHRISGSESDKRNPRVSAVKRPTEAVEALPSDLLR